jgi:hypothetical protein
MNWLQDNPFGRALVYACGVLLLMVIIIAIVWSLPVSVDATGAEAQEDEATDKVLTAREIVSINELEVINQKPLFNENRLPEIEEIDAAGEVVEDTTVTVRDAPDVRLTGVIITPQLKLATLTPSDPDLENVMVHEGQALVGQYLGWKIGEVNPRTIMLRSNDGQQLKLDLQVHEAKIKEPPKPVAAVESAPAEEVEVGEDGEPLSRAEQIRQRIAERREELRIQQERQQGQDQPAEDRVIRGSSYQTAVRRMIQGNSKDQGSDDKKDR